MTLKPLDGATILDSVSRTGRLVLVQEAPLTGDFGAEVAARVAQHALTSLLAPIECVAEYDTVMPYPRTEALYMPDVERVMAAVRHMTPFRLLDLGEGLREAELVAWHVAEGGHVVIDQPLVSVETEKAVVEIPSPQSGRIARLLAKPGEHVQVGAPLLAFEEGLIRIRERLLATSQHGRPRRRR